MNADDLELNLFGVVPSFGMDDDDDEELKRTEVVLHFDKTARQWNMIVCME